MARAVDVAAEVGALLGELAVVAEAENLEAAAVGEDGAVPAVELVQSARPGDYVHPGTQIQVVGVAQDYLGVHGIVQLVRVHGLYRADGAHGHKDGGEDLAVRRRYLAGAGFAAGGCMLKFEIQETLVFIR